MLSVQNEMSQQSYMHWLRQIINVKKLSGEIEQNTA